MDKTGISRKVQKSFNDGKVDLVYPVPMGFGECERRTYKTRNGATKGIKKLRDDRYSIRFIKEVGDRIEIWFNEDFSGRPMQYYQDCSAGRMYVSRPMADWEFGRRKS